MTWHAWAGILISDAESLLRSAAHRRQWYNSSSKGKIGRIALNIKNERVSRLARELAQFTGYSVTDAVGDAIEARLAELRRQRDRQDLAEKLLDIGRKCASQAPADWRTRDFDSELYDERGLPR